jgi:hypothetical protein
LSATDAGCTTDFIDNLGMSRGPTATGGYWYVFSDRTCVSYYPPRIKADAAGTLGPEEGQPFDSVDDGTGPIPPCESRPVPFLQLRAGGESIWGAGMGFDLIDLPSSASPFAACPPERCDGRVAPNALGARFAAPWDALDPGVGGPFRGISFWAQTVDTAAPLQVEVTIADRSTHPGGMVCDPCLYGAAGGDEGGPTCYDDWLETFTATSAWQPFTVGFRDPHLQTAGWAKAGGAPRPSSELDLTSLFSVHFVVPLQGSGPLPPFTLRVAYVSWSK